MSSKPRSLSGQEPPVAQKTRHNLPGSTSLLAQLKPPIPAKKDLRGQFFVRDEVLDLGPSIPARPPSSVGDADPTPVDSDLRAASHPVAEPTHGRRKQVKPHRLSDAKSQATTVLTQRGQGALCSDAVMADDSDDSGTLVIDTGMTSPAAEAETPIAPTPAVVKELVGPPSRPSILDPRGLVESEAADVDTDSPGDPSDGADKAKKLRKRKPSSGAEAGSDTDEEEAEVKPPADKRVKVSGSTGGSQSNVSSKSPKWARSSSSGKKKAKAESTPNPAAKKPRPSVTHKFEQVEDALEAMFAGLEDDKSGPSVLKEAIPNTSTVNENPPSLQEVNGLDHNGKGEPTKAKVRKKPIRKSSSNVTPKRRDKDKKVMYTPTKQEELLSKFNGPFVHVKGELLKPEWSNVINTPIDNMKGPGKRVGINENEHRKKVQGLTHSSTLSGTYDAKNSDASWICVFCKRSSHFEQLGDLFGPYFVPGDTVSAGYKQIQSAGAMQEVAASKFILGGDSSSPKKKKRRKLSEPSKEQVEVWFHEDCLCWLPEISLIGNRLVGLETAISGAESTTCFKCRKSGSTMTCIRSGCREVIHYPCAKQAKWHLDQSSFEAFCVKHASSESATNS